MTTLYRPDRRKGQKVRKRTGTGHYALQRLEALFPPLLLLLAASAVLYGAVGYGYPWLEGRMKDLEFFSLAEVSILGNRTLTEDEVLEGSGLHFGDNVLTTDLESVRDVLLAHPLIRTVAVRRLLPAGILIEVEERSAAAVIRAEGSYVVDGDGFVMHAAEEGGYRDLPCFTGLAVDARRVGPVAAGSLRMGIEIVGTMRAVGFPLLEEVDCIDLGDQADAVILPADGGPVVHLGREKIAERLRRWRLVAGDMASRWDRIDYIDLRADGLVVARPAPPSEEENQEGEEG